MGLVPGSHVFRARGVLWRNFRARGACKIKHASSALKIILRNLWADEVVICLSSGANKHRG
jgi:hypothetical protein